MTGSWPLSGEDALCINELFLPELPVGDCLSKSLPDSGVHLDIAIFACLGVDHLDPVKSGSGVYNFGHNVQSIRIAADVFPFV